MRNLLVARLLASSDGFRIVGESVGGFLRQFDGDTGPFRGGFRKTAGRGDADPLTQYRTRESEPVSDGDRRLRHLLGRRSATGAVDGTTPSNTVRPVSTNSPMPSRSAAASVDIDRQGMNSAALQHLPRQIGGATVQHHLGAHGRDAVIDQPGRDGLVYRMDRREAGDSSQPALQRRGQQRFVELHHHCGVQPPGELGPMAFTPSAREAVRSRTAPASVIARCPPVNSNWAASVIGPGAWTLTVRVPPRSPAFSQASSSASMILVEQADGPPHHRATARGDPVAARHRVDPDVDEQCTGPADHVGADASARQLDKMRQGVQFTDDDLGGLPR